PGDVLFLGGNTWGWHDLEKIRQMKRQSGLALVILCHDLIPALYPHFFLPAFAATFERFLAFILEEAALILCNSPTTLQDLRGYAGRHGLPLPEARLLPLGHALPLRGASPPKGAPALQPGRFVLSVGTIQVRKNQQLLYQLWRRLAETRGTDDVPALVLL